MGIGQDRKLSASLEDYLEAIWNLADESGCARSKDIAEALGVARSSVTGALRLLREKGLAHHEPYGCVTLTRPGRAAAQEVARKHEILKSFFMKVLGVETEAAQRAACQAEHALESEIIGRLVSFTDGVMARNAGGRDRIGESRAAGNDRRRSSGVIQRAVVEQGQVGPLSAVKTGGKARLVRVDAGRGLNNRLASMGFVPDVEISVVSNGLPGPFVVVIKDVKMALGRGVAHKILVK